MVRVDGEDPIEVWNKHNQRLENAFITLNDKQYTKLHLKAPGTDLEVGLPKGHIWHGGAAVSASNIIFNPNMPTEEVYTSPFKDKTKTKLQLKTTGTELEVGLPKGHIWHGGAAVSASNIIFNPNMPTEEVYTSPHKYHVNGTVSSTKPLNYGGQLIDEFQLTFKEGKVVDFEAKSGEEALKNLLDADEGARRLGEMALVPDASPISQSGLIFYNTL